MQIGSTNLANKQKLDSKEKEKIITQEIQDKNVTLSFDDHTWQNFSSHVVFNSHGHRNRSFICISDVSFFIV